MKYCICSLVICLCALAGEAWAVSYSFYSNGLYDVNAVNLTTGSAANQNGYSLKAGTYGNSQNMSLLEFDLVAIGAGETVDSIALYLYSSGFSWGGTDGPGTPPVWPCFR